MASWLEFVLGPVISTLASKTIFSRGQFA